MGASISHGIYLSIGAAGLHRSLGVTVSFVQSTTMDSWKQEHLKMMELGGNRRFHDFLKEHGVPEDMPIREKYRTRAAVWYRDDLKARAQGLPLPVPLVVGTGHLPSDCRRPSSGHVLDEVFSTSPRRSSMTNGGVRRSHVEQPHKEETSETNLQSICKKLSACFRLRRQSTESHEHELKDPFDSRDAETPALMSNPALPTLLGLSQCEVAKVSLEQS